MARLQRCRSGGLDALNQHHHLLEALGQIRISAFGKIRVTGRKKNSNASWSNYVQLQKISKRGGLGMRHVVLSAWPLARETSHWKYVTVDKIQPPKTKTSCTMSCGLFLIPLPSEGSEQFIYRKQRMIEAAVELEPDSSRDVDSPPNRATVSQAMSLTFVV